jgi:hypothetical protein
MRPDADAPVEDDGFTDHEPWSWCGWTTDEVRDLFSAAAAFVRCESADSEWRSPGRSIHPPSPAHIEPQEQTPPPMRRSLTRPRHPWSLAAFGLAGLIGVGSCGRPQCGVGDGIVRTTNRNAYTICNAHYVVVLNRISGQLMSATRRDPTSGAAVITEDRIVIQPQHGSDGINLATLRPERIAIEVDRDYYMRVATSYLVRDPGGFPLTVERRYEFTTSPHIYEHLSIYTEKQATAGVNAFTQIQAMTWTVGVNEMGAGASVGSLDFYGYYPDGPLGGWTRNVEALRWATAFVQSPYPSTHPDKYVRTLVHDGEFHGASSPAIIRDGHMYAVSGVLSVGRPADPLPSAVVDFSENIRQLYSTVGLLGEGAHAGEWTFVDWNHYTPHSLIPVVENGSVVADINRDLLIRMSVHLAERMQQDGGWPRNDAWSIYPRGDIQTPNSRAFPVVAYTWGLLTLRWENGGWAHQPAGADTLLDQLNALLPFYRSGSTPNFEDRRGSQGESYIAYSASYKEMNGDPEPRGVLNAHAHALHFAWLMAGANGLRATGASVQAAAEWRQILDKYHSGSKRLFRDLYPGTKSGPQWGLVNYEIKANPEIKNADYNTISFEGIAAGYLENGDYEPEFLEVAERAMYLDYDPLTSGSQTAPDPGFVARLCRVFPPALLFAGSTVAMSRKTYVSSVDEVLSAGRLLTTSELGRDHDPSRYIIEGDGRHIIYTNLVFGSEWVPGFWEERSAADVADNMRFAPNITFAAPTSNFGYVVSRSGNVLLIVSDHDIVGGQLLFPKTAAGPLRYRVTVRDYAAHQWSAERLVSQGTSQLFHSSLSIPVPGVAARSLVIVTIL